MEFQVSGVTIGLALLTLLLKNVEGECGNGRSRSPNALPMEPQLFLLKHRI